MDRQQAVEAALLRGAVRRAAGLGVSRPALAAAVGKTQDEIRLVEADVGVDLVADDTVIVLPGAWRGLTIDTSPSSA